MGINFFWQNKKPRLFPAGLFSHVTDPEGVYFNSEFILNYLQHVYNQYNNLNHSPAILTVPKLGNKQTENFQIYLTDIKGWLTKRRFY